MDVIILFPRQTRVYMLSEGLLILGICGQTSTPHGRTS